MGPVAAWSPKGSQATSARAHTAGESQSHSGRQTELGRPGRRQGDFSRVPPAPEAPPPKTGSGSSQSTPKGGSTLFPRTHQGSGKNPQRDPEWGSARQGAFQGRAEPSGQAASPGPDDQRVGQRTHGNPRGTSPTFPWMQDTPERLRSRLRWTPRPVPESSKPTLILLHAGKDDAGALDTSMPTTRPSRSTFGQWTLGGDLGQDMLGDEPYSTMCSMAMAGKVAFVGGGPNCRTWSILTYFPKPGGPPPARGRAEQTCGAWRTWSPG